MYLLARSEPLVSMIRSTTNHQTYPKSIPSKNSINQQYQIILILIQFLSFFPHKFLLPPKKKVAQMIRTSMQRYKNQNCGVGWLLWTWKLTTLGTIYDGTTKWVRSSDELMDEWCGMMGYYRCVMIVTTSWWSLSKRIDLVYKSMQLGFADNKQVPCSAYFPQHWPWRMQ